MIHLKLAHAVTEYDRKQSKRRGYNPNALGMYLAAVDQACNDIDRGIPARRALEMVFCDRLLDVCLQAAEVR